MKLSIKIRCIENDKYKKITLNSFCFFNKNASKYMFHTKGYYTFFIGTIKITKQDMK